MAMSEFANVKVESDSRGRLIARVDGKVLGMVSGTHSNGDGMPIMEIMVYSQCFTVEAEAMVERD